MIKTYKAKTCISINVRLANGNYKHITFQGQTLGSSIYRTGDAGLQQAIERHPKFGKSITAVEEAPQVKKPVAVEEEKKPKEVVLNMRCLDDAKEYLAERFGASRTKLRTRANAEEVARAHGERIVWLS